MPAPSSRSARSVPGASVVLLKFGDIPRSYPGISDRAWNVGGVLIQPQYVLIAGVAVLAAIALTLFLRRTIVGQALVACADYVPPPSSWA